MTSNSSFISPLTRIQPLVFSAFSGCALIALSMIMAISVNAQQSPQQTPQQQPEPKEKVVGGFIIHQSIDLGGHIAEQSGSGATYATFVNIYSGPRILDQSLTMNAVDPRHAPIYDRLSTSSFGYGGDPYNVTYLNFSKGHIYDFRGSFRRDRHYFDYDLLANPLIPPNSNPYVPWLTSPHLYNTVRRITDLNLTLAPLSRISIRFGYNHNISEGPSYSSYHVSADAQLLQNWRNSTDAWIAGVDWKPDPRTTFSYDQFITHNKVDTNWGLADVNYRLSNGTPVSLGINLSSVWNAPCAAPFISPGVVSPTCSAFLSYTRFAPTRTLFPTEQIRFQSTAMHNVTVTGRLLYSGATSKLINYYEVFNGLNSRASQRQSIVTGSANAERINVNGDFGGVWQITPKISASETYDYWYFRQPATNTFTETDYAGTSMLQPPGAASTTTSTDYQFLNQKTQANTFIVAWNVTPQAGISVGYRYRSRLISNVGDFTPIHEQWGLFGASLRPTPELRINANFDGMYADNAFTRISPRQIQHYLVRSTYKPRPWLSASGTINIYEARNNVQTVNHREHNRDFSFGLSVIPSEKWSMDMNYAYNSVFSTTLECFPSTPAPPGSTAAPSICVSAGTPLAGNGYYNQPTQYGSIGFTFAPMTRVQAKAGYRMNAVNGTSEMINVRQVPGSLQSQYQSPYGGVYVQIAPQWTWKADYNYYGYGEGTPIGPTLPRSFHGNIVTLAVNWAF